MSCLTASLQKIALFSLLSMPTIVFSGHRPSQFHPVDQATVSVCCSDILHQATFWVCVIVSVLVSMLLLYTLIQHQRTATTPRSSLPFTSRLSTEMIWALIPFLILILLITPPALTMMKARSSSNDFNLSPTQDTVLLR